MAKFKVKKVAVFGYGGKDYGQGYIVELSAQDAGLLTPCDYLEPFVEPEKPCKLEKRRK